MSNQCGIQVTERRRKTQVILIVRGKHDCIGREGEA